MPYTTDHLLLRFGGPSADAQETWSCGLRLAPTEPQSDDGLLVAAQDAIGDIATVVSNYVQSGSADFNSLCKLSFVKLNPISAATGDYLFPNDPVEHLFPDPLPTGSAALASPLQLAYVVTLRGTYRRGPAAFGRWYVPCGDASVTGTGVMSGAAAQAYADRAGDFLESVQFLNADVGKSLRVRLFGDGVGGPRESKVRQVDVGNVYDTQRRRRRSIDETYFTSTSWVEPIP